MYETGAPDDELKSCHPAKGSSEVTFLREYRTPASNVECLKSRGRFVIQGFIKIS